ncbi:MAG: FAD-binding oxidoreductase [Pseudomonadota bacterium]|nr:FAD-binding oxidoreductase [Pseudomonadota bacterium]
MPLVRTSSGKSFAATEGEALLDAALHADVTLAYSCRTGRCSTCKVRVRAGSTIAIHDEIGLSQSEHEAGWILACVRSAESDVDLEVDDLSGLQLFPAKTLPCRIHTIERVSTDVVKVVLRLPPTSDFKYYPGQYIDVIGQGGLRRSYSMANAPTVTKHIELHIRQVPSGAMSQYWFEQAKFNDLLRLNGPLGTFFLREIEGLDLIFLATGTGIAPVKAILEGLAQRREQPPRSISVFWGGRVPNDLYWNAREVNVDNQFVRVLSQAHDTWTGARGYVQQAVLRQAREWDRVAVYACGSDTMIHSARQQLVEAGLDERRFHSDAFVCSASA